VLGGMFGIGTLLTSFSANVGLIAITKVSLLYRADMGVDHMIGGMGARPFPYFVWV